jgi:molybdopterin molybdotransferase
MISRNSNAASACREARADVLVTLGGASVGDRDLLRPALARQGMSLDFWKIAMRPGKPLIYGALGDARILGLPGNPVASFVCALVFLAPPCAHCRAIQTPAPIGPIWRSQEAPSRHKGRRDYMRARLALDENGRLVATPQPLQDLRCSPSWRNRKRC